jgi:hypothetical protein
VTRVIERVKAHYEVREETLGTVYRWCPESVVVECNCGERLTLTAARTTCGLCEANHTPITEEVLDTRPEDKESSLAHSPRPYYAPTRGTKREDKEDGRFLMRQPREYPTYRRTPPNRCEHRLMSIVPIVPVRVEGGYASRCLLCGTVGPVRANGEAARRALLERGARNEE